MVPYHTIPYQTIPKSNSEPTLLSRTFKSRCLKCSRNLISVWFGMVWYGMVWYGMVPYHTEIKFCTCTSSKGQVHNFACISTSPQGQGHCLVIVPKDLLVWPKCPKCHMCPKCHNCPKCPKCLQGWPIWYCRGHLDLRSWTICNPPLHPLPTSIHDFFLNFHSLSVSLSSLPIDSPIGKEWTMKKRNKRNRQTHEAPHRGGHTGQKGNVYSNLFETQLWPFLFVANYYNTYTSTVVQYYSAVLQPCAKRSWICGSIGCPASLGGWQPN